MEKIILAVKDWFLNLSAAHKRALVLGSTIGFSLILTIVVLAAMQVSGTGKLPAVPERPNIISPIPPEDMFLPAEPDFVPGVLLEREQRTSWTEQDALEYWRNPLENGEEQWREKIKSTIDDLLEHIP